MRRRLIKSALGVALVVLLSACNVASHIVVQPDGSGTYSVTLTVADGPDHPGDALYKAVQAGAAKSDVPLPVEQFSQGGESGAKISYAFRSLDDLKAENERLAKVGSGLGGIAITRGDAGWHFSADSAEGLVRDPTSSQSGPPGGIIDATQLAGLIHLAVVVELPGLPAANNASAVTHTDSTSEFTWTIEVGRAATPLDAKTTFTGDQGSVKLATELTPVAAPSDASGAGSGAQTGRNVGIGVGAAIVVGAGVLLLRRRRNTANANS
jgi:hypothetical protein